MTVEADQAYPAKDTRVSPGSRKRRSTRGPRANVIIGGSIVCAVLLLALVSLVWLPYDPNHAVPSERLQGSSWQHLFGTDRYGRDVFSRITAGSRITLFVGVVAVTISALFGVPLGIAAGIRRGWLDTLIMRGADILLAFPALLLAIVCGAVFGPSTLTAMIAIGIAGIPAFARVARAGTLQVMTQDYIRAARLAHQPIAIPHVLPNIMALIIVQATVAFALAILAEAALSFLGLGTPPPDPSWAECCNPPKPPWALPLILLSGRDWPSRSPFWDVTSWETVCVTFWIPPPNGGHDDSSQRPEPQRGRYCAQRELPDSAR